MATVRLPRWGLRGLGPAVTRLQADFTGLLVARNAAFLANVTRSYARCIRSPRTQPPGNTSLRVPQMRWWGTHHTEDFPTCDTLVPQEELNLSPTLRMGVPPGQAFPDPASNRTIFTMALAALALNSPARHST